jgi:type IV secretory pathway VirB10-like protein
VDIYEGGFKDYQDALERQRRAQPSESQRPSPRAAPPKPEAREASKADDRGQRKAEAREVEKKRKRAAELERQIESLEGTLAGFREELKVESGSNWERLHELAVKDREYSELLERAMKEWLTLSEELARASAPEGARK